MNKTMKPQITQSQIDAITQIIGTDRFILCSYSPEDVMDVVIINMDRAIAITTLQKIINQLDG